MPTSTLGNAIGNLLPEDLYPLAIEKVFLPRYHAVSPIRALTKRFPRIIGTQIVYPTIGQSTVNTLTTDTFNGKIPVQNITAEATTINLNQVSTWAYTVPPFMETLSPARVMTEQLIDNAQTLSDCIATQVLSQMFAGAGTQMGTVEISIENAYINLIDMNTKLNKLNVPSRGRRFIIDYDYYNLLEKSERLNRDTRVEPNGYISGFEIAGYEVYVTNLLTSTPGTTGENPTNPTGQAMLIQEDAFGYADIVSKTQYIDGAVGNMCETMQGALRWGAGYLLPNNAVACTCSYTMDMPSNVEYTMNV
ncbi:hypothetical protein [Sarcina ventriculi]|uniref:hypothetical protein n=1 Tax=Sarcina ventriculi TaxID=1267 RepID=UPI0018AB2DBF|nr:hypothetical protein [Sarcina ventriculi]